MNVNLDKAGLVALVYGMIPTREQMDRLQKRKLGEFIGGFANIWNWDRFSLESLSEQELYNLYLQLKFKNVVNI